MKAVTLERRSKAAAGAPKVKVYFVEYNRSRGDSRALFVRRLRRAGLSVTALPHKTAFRIARPIADVSFGAMQRSLTACLDPRRGSVILFSGSTGRAWVMSNRGNRPGEYIRQ